MTHWPFEVIEKDGSPLIKVNYLGEDKTFSPQEISSMVLIKMKEISEAKLGKTVKKAVVTFVSLFYSSAARINYSDLSAFLPTSTTPSVSPQKMLVPSLVLMFFVSSMSLLPPPSLTVLTASQRQKRMFLSSTWEEELSMFPC